MTEVKTALLNPRFFRPKTEGDIQHVNFAFVSAGLGDYIGYLASIEWLAKTQPQVHGHVYGPDFFNPIAANVLKKYPNWEVCSRAQLADKQNLKRPTCAPNKFITRVGMNAVDLGYVYYASMHPAPEDGYNYPRLDLEALPPPQTFEKEYAVLTPYSTHSNRTMSVKAFNGVKDYLISKNISPVFIGRRDFAPGRKSVFINEGFDFSGGVDLTNQTTLLEAAAIMAKAKMVIGLDNGLLHLAAMTEVPIIFGFTVASPEHAEPRRKNNPVYRVFPDPNSLNCTFCQSRMRMFRKNVDFAKCVYNDDLCTEVIGDPKDWTVLVDRILANG